MGVDRGRRWTTSPLAVGTAAACVCALAYIVLLGTGVAAQDLLRPGSRPATLSALAGGGDQAGAARQEVPSAAIVTAPEQAGPITAVRAPAARPGAPWRLGKTALHLVDHSRPAPVRVGSGSRVLDVVIDYPIDGDPAAAPVGGGPRAAGGHSFPLIVFVHGFDVTPTTYQALTADWARAGYVVASPALPGEVAGPGTPEEADLVNEPADVSFVISALIAAQRGAGPLHGAIDISRIGVAGHSDGGEAAAAVGLDSCCRDPRISAVIVMSGAEMTVPGGSYVGTRHAPSLVIQAQGDEIDDPANAVKLFDDSPGPSFYLELVGGEHLEPFTGADPRWAIVPRVTTDFWDLELRGGPGRLPTFERDAGVAGATRLYRK